jgi:hypothetical protein
MYSLAYGQNSFGRLAAIRAVRIRAAVMPFARSARPLRVGSYGGEVSTVILLSLKYPVVRLLINSWALLVQIVITVSPLAFICLHQSVSLTPRTARVSAVKIHC